MNDLSPADKYILRAQGKLDGYRGYVNYISNPDLPLGSQKDIEVWKEEIQSAGNKVWSRIGFAGTVVFTPAMYLLLAAGPRNHSFSVELGMGAFLSLLLSFMFGMLFVMGSQGRYERNLLKAKGAKAESLMWQGVPDKTLTGYRLQEEALEKLRKLDIDSDAMLACSDLEDEMQLLLRQVKASKDPAEQDILGLKAQDLAVETTALAYAWQDRVEAEQAAVEQALQDTGVNVRALIERAVDSPLLLSSDDNILSQVEEREIS